MRGTAVVQANLGSLPNNIDGTSLCLQLWMLHNMPGKYQTEDKIEDFIVRLASTSEGSPGSFGVSVSTCIRSEISLRAALAPNMELHLSHRKEINYDINI